MNIACADETGTDDINSHGDEIRTIRVGFFELDNYHEIDENGKMSGYGYDFLELCRKYSNLNYEFTGYDNNWTQIKKMLLNGEIDIVTSAQKTDSMLKQFDFSTPIGTATIQLLTLADSEYVPDDYENYDGMKIGVVAGRNIFNKLDFFAKKKGFDYRVKFFNTELEMANALLEKKVDAIVDSSLRNMDNEKILAELDQFNIYAIVRKGNTELLKVVNYAIQQMDTSEGDWRGQLFYQNFNQGILDSLSFSEEEKTYIEQHSVEDHLLIVSTDTDWEPFSYLDNGEYRGILPDYWDALMKLCGMKYEYLDATELVTSENELVNGRADVYLAYANDSQTADEKGLIASEIILSDRVVCLTRKDKKSIRFCAAPKTTPHLNQMINVEKYETIPCENVVEAFEMVKSGKLDAVYTYEDTAVRLLNREQSNMFSYSVIQGSELPIRIVVSENADHRLMAIISKCIKQMRTSQVETIVADNIADSVVNLSVFDFFMIHPGLSLSMMVAFLIILLIYVALISYSRASDQRRDELQKQLEMIEELRETERKHKIELQNKEEVERANRAKSRFLANISHDIRTPMTAILGFADVAETHIQDQKRIKDCLDKIKSSGEYISGIFDEILDVSMIEGGKMILRPKETNLYQDVECAVNSIMPIAEKKHVELKCEFHASLDINVRMDGVRFTRTIVNLLGNAVKFTKEGGVVTLEIRELKEISNNDSEADRLVKCYEIKISDTGIGISKEFLPRIFDSFEREQTSTLSGTTGTGLGLAIVKNFVDLMHGSITVNSEKNVGTTFTMVLPIEVIHEETEAVHSAEEEKQKKEIKFPQKVLLVEDIEYNREIINDLLTDAGYHVEQAENGKEALEMVQSRGITYYDLILMDLQMPVMNGYEATEKIRSLPGGEKNQLKIIALSANAIQREEKELMKYRMDGYLTKPFKIKELTQRLEALL